jgi:hypothetical protein
VLWLLLVGGAGGGWGGELVRWARAAGVCVCGLTGACAFSQDPKQAHQVIAISHKHRTRNTDTDVSPLLEDKRTD